MYIIRRACSKFAIKWSVEWAGQSWSNWKSFRLGTLLPTCCAGAQQLQRQWDWTNSCEEEKRQSWTHFIPKALTYNNSRVQWNASNKHTRCTHNLNKIALIWTVVSNWKHRNFFGLRDIVSHPLNPEIHFTYYSVRSRHHLPNSTTRCNDHKISIPSQFFCSFQDTYSIQ